MKHTLLLIVGLVFFSGCKTLAREVQPTSQLTEFRALKSNSEEALPNFRLDAVDRLAPAPSKGTVAYSALNQYFEWQRDFSEPHLMVSFPSLTKGQFDALKNTYGFGLSRIQYQSGVTYTLSDFLMPFMQATLNHAFEVEIQGDYTSIAGNCWGTAYEVIRTSKDLDQNDVSGSVAIFYADTPEMQAILQANTRSRLLGVGASIDDLYEQAQTTATPFQFGDIVLILDGSGLLEHVITYVDRDVWFEKVGYSAGAPYRLTTTEDFFHKIKDGRQVEWRRFPRGGLPHPSQAFKTVRFLENAPGNTTRILDEPVAGELTHRDVKFVFDEIGRAALESAAFKPAHPRAASSQ